MYLKRVCIVDAMKFSLFFVVNVERHSCDPIYPLAMIAFFYGPEYYTEYFLINEFENIKQHPLFDPNKPNILYIHGYREYIEDESIKLIVAAYLTRNDHNIFALDWSMYADGNYVTNAVPNVVGLGHLLGIRLNSWIESGFIDPKKLHIVGHSLGAQMAGYIGKMLNLASVGTRKIKRITGLDPAKPLFYTNLTAILTYIHKDDAVLVDIIHTNAGFLGSSVSVGNCDFWPNGGVWQAGCAVKAEPRCDHQRSWHYYAESVRSKEPNFNSILCDDYTSFKKLECTDDVTNFMGFHATDDCSGVFYLQTNTDSPFSRGVFGLQYSPLSDLDRDRQNGD